MYLTEQTDVSSLANKCWEHYKTQSLTPWRCFGQAIGIVERLAQMHSEGASGIYVLLDPWLACRAMHMTRRLSPGQRIKLAVMQWQDTIVEATSAAGCTNVRIALNRTSHRPPKRLILIEITLDSLNE
jgi:hypothetical protein